jgi:hypothetical protein
MRREMAIAKAKGVSQLALRLDCAKALGQMAWASCSVMWNLRTSSLHRDPLRPPCALSYRSEGR